MHDEQIERLLREVAKSFERSNAAAGSSYDRARWIELIRRVDRGLTPDARDALGSLVALCEDLLDNLSAAFRVLSLHMQKADALTGNAGAQQSALWLESLQTHLWGAHTSTRRGYAVQRTVNTPNLQTLERLGLAIHRYMQEDGRCFPPSARELATETGLVRSTVQNGLKYLLASGWLEEIESPKRPGRGWRGKAYRATIPPPTQ
jgi:hypothetical protein